jgi:hypothetical protein
MAQYDINTIDPDELYNVFYRGSPGFVPRGDGGGGGGGDPNAGRNAIVSAMLAQQMQPQPQPQQQMPQAGGGDFGIYDRFYAGSPGFTPGRGPGYGSNPWAPGYPRRPAGDDLGGGGFEGAPGSSSGGGAPGDFFEGHPGGPSELAGAPGQVGGGERGGGRGGIPDAPPQVPDMPPLTGEPVPYGANTNAVGPYYGDQPYGRGGYDQERGIYDPGRGPNPYEQQIQEQMQQYNFGPQTAIDNPLTAYGYGTDKSGTVNLPEIFDPYGQVASAPIDLWGVDVWSDPYAGNPSGYEELPEADPSGSYSEVEDPYGEADYDEGGFESSDDEDEE